jgi:hypothetical protein
MIRNKFFKKLLRAFMFRIECFQFFEKKNNTFLKNGITSILKNLNNKWIAIDF